MLFRAGILERIADGEIDLAFRCWARPAIREGTRLRTAVGAIVIGKVTPVGAGGPGLEDARRAGFADIAALMNDLRTGEGRTIYRIVLAGIEPDERIVRQNGKLTEVEMAGLAARLAHWDRIAPADNYHWKILRLISERPGVAAAELSAVLGVEKLKFKRDVRKLKELGLTISLDTGYRLSLRGNSLLEGSK